MGFTVIPEPKVIILGGQSDFTWHMPGTIRKNRTSEIWRPSHGLPVVIKHLAARMIQAPDGGVTSPGITLEFFRNVAVPVSLGELLIPNKGKFSLSLTALAIPAGEAVWYEIKEEADTIHGRTMTVVGRLR